MTKEDLIFDWKKSENRSKDKLLALLIVIFLFTVFFELFNLGIPTFRSAPVEGAGLIRFTDQAIARSWLLEAEENGPFPGRLELDGDQGAATFLDGAKLSPWTNYQVEMRPFPEANKISRAEITPKGKRVFPVIRKASFDPAPEVSEPREMRRIPILTPFDRAALEWMPVESPDFVLPSGAELAPDSLRFTLSLREDGSVAEILPISGVADPTQEAMLNWLQGVRFKKGIGERWFGLCVEFVNRREDVAEPK